MHKKNETRGPAAEREMRAMESEAKPMPAVLSTPKAHGYGHDAIKRQGKCRMSGHPGAHRLGKRK